MIDLSVKICGVELKNPVIPASGTFGFGREFNEIYDISVLGGVATKGLTLEPRLGNPVPRIAESRGVILNAVGLQNPGVESFLQNDLAWLNLKRAYLQTSQEKPWTTMRRSAQGLTGLLILSN